MSSCPVCGRSQSKVTRTRETRRGTSRRRECLDLSCRSRWMTIEIPQQDLKDLRQVVRRLGRGVSPLLLGAAGSQ
jgi:transcriptional regulator NrdR family protein